MSAPSRWAPRVCRFCRASPTPRRTFASASATSTTTTETKPQQWPQRQPRGEYYDILLRDPPPYANNKAEKPPSSAQPAASPPPPSPSSSEAKAATPSGSSPARTYETISSRTAYSDSNTTTAAAADREATAEERARVIFGSRLLGPAERADRAAGRQAKSTTIAGVLVPPRPEEPDNCCMSGCVNCVWDLFREDMEEWTLKSNEAKRRLAESAAAAGVASPTAKPTPVVGAGPAGGGGGGVGGGVGRGLGVESPASSSSSSSMDADGGGSVANWPTTGGIGETKIAKDMWTDDLFQNVPVGIREFMKQEKRLKEKHQREGTSGG